MADSAAQSIYERHEPRVAVREPDETTRADEVSRMYRTHYLLLFHVATEKFRVPSDEVPALIHDVFVAYLRAPNKVENLRAWLVGAICNASRSYWRGRKNTDDLPSTNGRTADELVADVSSRVLLASVLQKLQPSFREVLRLRYEEGLTTAELADRLGTTPGYAEQVLVRSLKRARLILQDLEGNNDESSI